MNNKRMVSFALMASKITALGHSFAQPRRLFSSRPATWIQRMSKSAPWGAIGLLIVEGASPETEAEQPQPTKAAETPSSSAERDGQRRADLDRLNVALREYRDKYGSFPSTGGSIQTVCVYLVDAGCELGEFLNPLPEESMGPPYGYWYESDGSTFTLYTALESPPPGEELCSSKPEYLAGVPYLWCIAGP